MRQNKASDKRLSICLLANASKKRYTHKQLQTYNFFLKIEIRGWKNRNYPHLFCKDAAATVFFGLKTKCNRKGCFLCKDKKGMATIPFCSLFSAVIWSFSGNCHIVWMTFGVSRAGDFYKFHVAQFRNSWRTAVAHT